MSRWGTRDLCRGRLAERLAREDWEVGYDHAANSGPPSIGAYTLAVPPVTPRDDRVYAPVQSRRGGRVLRMRVQS